MRIRSGLWRHLDGLGYERFELTRSDEGWRLAGTLLVQADRGPVEARYDVTCDAEWVTRRTVVALRDDRGERGLDLRCAGGRWTLDGAEVAAVRGCADVDLEWSPSTNTLPLRRLRVPVGSTTGELRMAWVRFPSLAIEPLDQEYRRVTASRYRFTSGAGSFEADIEVDADSLVVKYEGGWERVGPANGTDARSGH